MCLYFLYAVYWSLSNNVLIRNLSIANVAPRMREYIITRPLSEQILSASFNTCACWRHNKHHFEFSTVHMHSLRTVDSSGHKEGEEWVEGSRIMRNSRWKGTRDKGRGKGEDGKRANWIEDYWMLRKLHDESSINYLLVSVIRYVTADMWRRKRGTAWFDMKPTIRTCAC